MVSNFYKVLTFDNPYIKFLPFVILYSVYFFFNLNHTLILDEGRYWNYAGNILQGFYADPTSDMGFLWNGPGYPMFLVPFRLLNLPFNVAKAFNILFLYFGVIYLYKSLLFFQTKKVAFRVACFFGLLYPMYSECLIRLQVETISIFLICLFCYFILAYNNFRARKYIWFAAVTLGYLILTKIFFSAVSILVLVCLLPFYLSKKYRTPFKTYIKVVFLGLLFTFPYLIYTYCWTGKPLYYSNAGGLSLYWMSTPYENELGDWLNFEGLEDGTFIKQNHLAFFDSIQYLPPVEKDQAFKKKAVENMMAHPGKFFKNFVLNVERLFIMTPTAFQKTPFKNHLIFFFPHIILFLLLVWTVFITPFRLSLIPPIFIFLLIIVIVYIGAVSLFSAFTRFLYPIIPVMLLYISMMLYSSNKKENKSVKA